MFTKKGRLRLVRAQWRSFTHATLVSTATWSAYEIGYEGMNVWASVHAYFCGAKIYEKHGNDLETLLVEANVFLAEYRQKLEEKHNKVQP